jgi:uncharacterized protein (DUF3084 family)
VEARGLLRVLTQVQIVRFDLQVATATCCATVTVRARTSRLTLRSLTCDSSENSPPTSCRWGPRRWPLTVAAAALRTCNGNLPSPRSTAQSKGPSLTTQSKVWALWHREEARAADGPSPTRRRRACKWAPPVGKGHFQGPLPLPPLVTEWHEVCSEFSLKFNE